MKPSQNVIKWKHFPCYWPFVRGIHRSPVNSLHKDQWRGASMFSLICAWMNGWVNSVEAGDLRHHRTHYDVTVMQNLIYHTAAKLSDDRIIYSILRTQRAVTRKMLSFVHDVIFSVRIHYLGLRFYWIIPRNLVGPSLCLTDSAISIVFGRPRWIIAFDLKPHDCLLNRLFRHTPQITSKLRVTDPCEGNPSVTCGFPSQRTNNAANDSIWWRHDENVATQSFFFVP